MTSTATEAAWRPLGRNDLTDFDTTMTDIVLKYIEFGWVGRMSSNGHALLRSPDGEYTETVSRSSNRGRSGTNAQAALDRWVKNRPGAALGVPLSADTEIHSYAQSEETREAYAQFSSNESVQKHLASLIDGGLTREEITARIQVLATEGETGGWYIIDTLERRVLAHGDTITEEEAYAAHFAPVDPVDPRPFKCTECGDGFKTKRSRGSHYRGHALQAKRDEARKAAEEEAKVVTPPTAVEPSDGDFSDEDVELVLQIINRATETTQRLTARIAELTKALDDANAKISLITEALSD